MKLNLLSQTVTFTPAELISQIAEMNAIIETTKAGTRANQSAIKIHNYMLENYNDGSCELFITRLQHDSTKLASMGYTSDDWKHLAECK
jgi:hypothetical protein